MLEKCIKINFNNLIRKYGKILVIGIGKYGKEFLHEYKEIQDRFILCDNSIKKQEEGILVGDHFHKIYPINILTNFEKKDMLIVITSLYYAEIYAQIAPIVEHEVPVFVYPFISSRAEILDECVKDCLYLYGSYSHWEEQEIDSFVDTKYKSIKENKTDKIILPHMSVMVTTKCTLNCEKCNNLMPYFRKKQMQIDADIEKIKNSIDIILKNVAEMIFCELVGGEPFLYKDIDKLIEFVGKQQKIKKIVIVTNGTIIPKDETIKLLKKYNVTVRISDYGLFEKMSSLINILEKNDINAEIFQDMKWVDTGDIHRRGCNYNELFLQYNKCKFSVQCKYLWEDKLFTCARILSLNLLGVYDGEEDILFINEYLSEKLIKDFYLHDIGRGCDYCDKCSIYGGYEIEAAVQVGDKKLDKSIYTVIRKDELEKLKKLGKF